MTRPDPRPAVARPTLFGAAPSIHPLRSDSAGVELRMLRHPDEPTRRVAVAASKRLLPIVGGATLVLAAAGALCLRTKTPAPPLPTGPTSVAPALPQRRASAAAVIESVAPARSVDSAHAAAEPPVATTAAVQHASKAAAARRATPHAASAAPGHTATADADVDLLAAMVTRLRAAEAASAAVPTTHRADDTADDSRAAAR